MRTPAAPPARWPRYRRGWRTAAPALGDYRILREIGRGGMGVVYEAEQESLGRRVASRSSRPALVDPKQVRRFEREAKAAARLHHTNIVPVFGVGRQDGHHYYVMQFIAGRAWTLVLRRPARLRAGQTRHAKRPSLPAELALHAPAAHRSGLTAAEVARSLLYRPFARMSPHGGRDCHRAT